MRFRYRMSLSAVTTYVCFAVNRILFLSCLCSKKRLDVCFVMDVLQQIVRMKVMSLQSIVGIKRVIMSWNSKWPSCRDVR